MNELHLCVPVLRRYDLLGDLLHSLVDSTVMPSMLHVIDNGRDPRQLEQAVRRLPPGVRTDLFVPDAPMGVAESWNWFISHTPEERLICNDDVTFGRDSIRAMVEAPGLIVASIPGNMFSCFVIRDACVKRIGLFDEAISPGYAYFEDCDYEQRLYDAGLRATQIECGVVHVHSATLAAASPEERAAHNEKFVKAQRNYVKKWGRLPRGVEEQHA